jgi:lambda family phage portal protein
MLKPAKRSSLRGKVALGMKGLGLSLARTFESGAMALGGFASGGSGGYESGRRDTRRTRGWRPGQGSAASDILPDLPELRGRGRDLDRNNPLAHGALNTRVNGIVGAGLQLRSVIDAAALGIKDQAQIEQLQYALEREWEIFEREADFAGQMHLQDLQRVWVRSADVSGDIGIARRYRKRPGETYGTRLVSIEADRICNPARRADSLTLQDGIELSAEGEVRGYHVSDKHPGDIRAGSLTWAFVPRRGAATGLAQFILHGRMDRPGQVRGVPIFAPVEETLKQLGDYTNAEIKAAINDAYLFAFEQQPSELDDEGQPIITRADGKADAAGELTLEDLTITTLPPGSTFSVKKPERPNTAFADFVAAFCKYLGAALGLPYEVLLMHFGSSFSASRGALEVAYKGFIVDRARFIRTVMDVVREWQFTEMVALGRFDAPGFFDDPIKRQAWLGREWIGPTRIQINPYVEANADRIDMQGAVKSIEQVMTERTGGSFDTKARQILRERALLGMTPAGEPIDQQAATTGSDATQGDNVK